MQVQNNTDTVTRVMLRTLATASRSGDTRCLDSLGIPLEDASTFATLSPMEIEGLIGECPAWINIDPLVKRIQAFRREYMIGQLMAAGCSNRVLRKVFGLPLRELSRLRARFGNPQPGRPRSLTETEETALHDYLQTRPVPDGTLQEQAMWCLKAHRRLHLPFMAIHSFTGEDE